MKKKFTSLLTLSSLLFVTVVQSQPNTFPSSGFVGIGTTTPKQRLHVEGPSNQAIFVSTSAPNSISGSGMIGYVKALPTAAGDRLGYFLLGSRGGNNFNYNVAGMIGYAEDAWTAGSSHPAYLAFETTLSGTTVRAERMRISGNGNVGIGTTFPSYKLHVESPGVGVYGRSTGGSYGVYGSSTYLGVIGEGTTIGTYGTGGTYGAYGTASTYGVYGTATSYGVYGIANTSSGYGVRGSGYYGTYGTGTFGAYGTGTYGTYGVGTSYGAVGTSTSGYGTYGGSTNSVGIYGISTNSNGGYFYSSASTGLYASTGRADNNYAAYFDGSIYVVNSYFGSDRALKQNIEEFTDALDIINKLKPKNYQFRHDGKLSALNLPKGNHYGLIAQDVEEILPNLVKETAHQLHAKPEAIAPGETGAVTNEKPESVSIKAVNYIQLIPILVKGMQELSAENKALRVELNDLKQRITRTNGQAISGALLQNSPNPVKGSTWIRYSLPDGTNKAHLLITDALGRTVKTVQLTTAGTVNVSTSMFSKGVYNYSLVIEGQTVDTKKMIVD